MSKFFCYSSIIFWAALVIMIAFAKEIFSTFEYILLIIICMIGFEIANLRLDI